MDFSGIIWELYEQKKRLDRVIADLEQLRGSGERNAGAAPRVRRRGRNSMGQEERRQVSERMKAYWAARRSQTPQDRAGENGQCG